MKKGIIFINLLGAIVQFTVHLGFELGVQLEMQIADNAAWKWQRLKRFLYN